MKLVENWRAVLRHAWSVRLLVIAVMMSGVEAALPLLEGVITVPPGIFAALSGFVGAGALLARVILQNDLSPENKDETNEPS